MVYLPPDQDGSQHPIPGPDGSLPFLDPNGVFDPDGSLPFLDPSGGPAR